MAVPLRTLQSPGLWLPSRNSERMHSLRPMGLNPACSHPELHWACVPSALHGMCPSFPSSLFWSCSWGAGRAVLSHSLGVHDSQH